MFELDLNKGKISSGTVVKRYEEKSKGKSKEKSSKKTNKRRQPKNDIENQILARKTFADQYTEASVLIENEKDPLKKEKMRTRLALGITDFEDL